MWPLLLEMCVSVAWSYAMLLVTVAWLLAPLLGGGFTLAGAPLGMGAGGVVLGVTCLVQFAFSAWLDGPYDRGLVRNLFWMIWYPLAFWLINVFTTVVGVPRALLRSRGERARWKSPDRGLLPDR